MRVLHVIGGLVKSAGTSVFCMEICDGLKGLGHDVSLAVPNPEETDRYASRKDVHIVSTSSVLNAGNGLPYDIVHIHGLWMPCLHPFFGAALRFGIPIVHSPHGMLAPWAMKHKRFKKMIAWWLYQKRDLKRVSAFHVTSEAEKEWVESFGFSKPVFAVPLGTYLSEIERCDVRQNSPLRRILFVGRIYTVKNLDALVKAFALVRGCVSSDKWQLVLVGPDQEGEKSRLISTARSLGLVAVDSSSGRFNFDSSEAVSADVLFTGALFDDRKSEVYRKSDLFVLPSHSENFGGVVIDALAHGLPVIVSRQAPWEEIEQHRCGLWVENAPETLAAAMRRLMLLSDAERREMGQRGRVLVEQKYTWSSVALRMQSEYEKVLYAKNF